MITLKWKKDTWTKFTWYFESTSWRLSDDTCWQLQRDKAAKNPDTPDFIQHLHMEAVLFLHCAYKTWQFLYSTISEPDRQEYNHQFTNIWHGLGSRKLLLFCSIKTILDIEMCCHSNIMCVHQFAGWYTMGRLPPSRFLLLFEYIHTDFGNNSWKVRKFTKNDTRSGVLHKEWIQINSANVWHLDIHEQLDSASNTQLNVVTVVTTRAKTTRKIPQGLSTEEHQIKGSETWYQKAFFAGQC